jgi:hypothetical protein
MFGADFCGTDVSSCEFLLRSRCQALLILTVSRPVLYDTRFIIIWLAETVNLNKGFYLKIEHFFCFNEDDN